MRTLIFGEIQDLPKVTTVDDLSPGSYLPLGGPLDHWAVLGSRPGSSPGDRAWRWVQG